MKNTFLLLLNLAIFVNISFAQESEIIGKWKLTEMQKGEEIKAVDSGIIFAENGVLKMGFFDMQEILEVGAWEYNKKQNAIYMNSPDEKILNGKAEIIEITTDKLEYKRDGIIHRLIKYKEKENSAMLRFSEADFFTEDGDYKYDADEEKIPWKNPSEMLRSLRNVNHLVYKYSKFNEESESFEDKSLTADVSANEDKMSLSIDNIFYGFDRYNLPEDMELPPNTEYVTFLYPVEEFYFRVVGTEELTIAAGTFLCTVVEAAQEEIQKKLWMINDKPGVYAKVIIEKPGMFGAYSLQIFELNEIK